MDIQSQETQNDDTPVVLPAEISPRTQQKLKSILRLLEPCPSKKEYGQRLREEAEKLEVSVRTMQRYISA